MHFLSEPGLSVQAGQHSQQIIKSTNLKRLFDLLNCGTQISRADLVRTTKLSPTTVSALIDELVARALVREVGTAHTVGTGRKPIQLEICNDGLQIPTFSFTRWGIRYTLFDLGLHELESFFITHPSDQYGGFTKDSTFEPDSGSDYADILYDVITNRSQCIDPERVCCICVSQPGLYIEEENRIACSALRVSIQGGTFEALEERLGYPVLLGNSSMAYAYAEKKYLNRAGDNVHNLIYLNVTDGIGAGIVYQDEILTGPFNTAGEIGSILCGSTDAPVPLEDEVNVHRILTDIRTVIEAGGSLEMLDLLDGSYDNLSLETIGAAYERRIEPVSTMLDAFAGKLYIGIHNIICITGIRQIVIGGGIERLGEAFLSRLIEISERTAKSVLTQKTSFTYSKSGFKGDSIGIAQYYIDKEFLTPDNKA